LDIGGNETLIPKQTAYDIAHAAGWAAGYAHKRNACCDYWSKEDYDEAARVMNELLDTSDRGDAIDN
jgi:hypothetical protein